MRYLNKNKITSIARNMSMKLCPLFLNAETRNSGQVMLYPQAKCAYNRIKKSANSSTTMFLADVMKSQNYDTTPELETQNYHAYKHQSIEAGVSLSRLWRPDQICSLQDYYWFTVVRNPYTRLLSAFLQRGTDDQRGSAPSLYTNIPGLNRRNPLGFKEFVGFLQNNGLYVDKHWWPQHKLLLLPAERYDYIAKTERLESDLGHILYSVGLSNYSGASFSKPHPAENSSEWKVTNANRRANEFYDDETREAVFTLYKSDFEKFGYDCESFN